MPVRMNAEKESSLAAPGAEIVRTPAVAWDDPESRIEVTRKLHREIPDAHIPDQCGSRYRLPDEALLDGQIEINMLPRMSRGISLNERVFK
ncbi:hypothetical protein [Burkholderia sp. Ac-20392]|uniref:hypothetical protein n=1 Tax=Burkholderia sp. Ac-20392 TaxID=2703905 RepID=UPI00197D7972|nr:hypothetical protein [Burkholderia sp. Ac-20392]MBN3794032.1 hypothetical protein [Burkholderia sp. Ac-20392]